MYSQTPDSPAAIESAAALRLVIGKLARRLRPTVAGSELTPTTTSVLFGIVRCGPVRLSALAEDEGLNPTMLSRVVAKLTEQGLVRRTCDPDDRRAALVEATPAGRRLRERIHAERADALNAHLAELSDDERAALAAALPVLERLAEQLKDRRA